LGDPDFVKIPVKELLDSVYIKNRMSDFSFAQASKSSIGKGKVQVTKASKPHTILLLMLKEMQSLQPLL
jgi:gamma-glutamyltranspeptidase